MDNQPRRFSLMLAAARAAVLWERALARFFPALLVGGVGLIALKSGILAAFPTIIRWPVAGLLALAFLAAIVRGVRLKTPTEQEAAHWLDNRNPQGGRAAESWLDALPAGADTAGSRTLWQAHRDRIAGKLATYRLGLPRSPLRDLDPYALRNAVALGLIATFMIGGVPLTSRVAELARPAENTAALSTLDLWLLPPQYTGKPPVLLASSSLQPAAAPDPQAAPTAKTYNTPEGSRLTARIAGLDAPKLLIEPVDAAGNVVAPGETTAFTVDEAGKGEAKAVLDRSARISLLDGDSPVRSWTVTVVDDTAPKIAVTKPVEVTPAGAMAIEWEASDDYGVLSVGGTVAMAPRDAGVPASPAVDPDSPFLKEAPKFDVTLQSLNPKTAKGREFENLSEHYWAGLEVDITLTAADQAGQKGASAPIRIKLPERQFNVPLAQALVEQRMVLIRTPQKRPAVVRTLAALMAWPADIFPTSGSYLAVQDAAAKLHVAATDEDIRQSIDLLWQIALGLEDGSLDQAMKELEQARRELQQAIAEGAPPEKIAELTQKLREAMNKYLQAMTEQMMERMRRGEVPQQANPQAQMLRQQDLQKMLDQIENLARSGSRDAAQELLAQLENMLKNMQPQMGQQQGGQQEGAMGQMMNQLGQMMRDQQRLMDETFRMQGGQQGQPQEGQRGQMPGQTPGQQQGQGRGGQQLSQDQQALGQALEEMMRQMGEMGMEAPQGMGRAGRSMEDAAGALGQGDRDQALQSQNEALQGLREGARQMAEQMMQQQGAGQQGRAGREGPSRGDDRDPLGRPLPRTGEDYGPDRNMVPGEAAIERARRILDYLRSRSGEPGRPQIELDYFERLLRGLY